ncbi:Rv2578c family radical SAM protein [Nesterenkonia natronophila]|uniref:Radical SAM protein n=1 Tax=Nesterenkonia natronophila TaxID=2174932 RepID=A0A3A4EZV9_9MICC|nr:Rv2578c family radical SAM protein [Nesterenkonia natronophila]RJN31423.1 radical SAM protein [Nesterenkonia natronophila]
MRWDSQKIDGPSAPALLPLQNLVRTVQTPEFEGVTFHEVAAKTALNKVPQASNMPFGWTVNPTRGCLHKCRYCFARKTHEYLEMDSGRDFDTQIVMKTNVAEVLRAELAKPSWRREHVALGTNTDPYQRAEGRYRLMPGIIRALAESGTPFSILTKGPMLKRDLPLLQEAAQRVPVSVAVSLAIMDTNLQQKVEPGTPDPRARLNLVRAITDAGLECNVLAMPILPWLTDSAEHLDQLHGELAGVGAGWVTTGALHLRPGAREWFMQWLQQEYPALVPRYQELYRGPRGGFTTYASRDYKKWLAQQAAAARQRHGFLDRVEATWRERSSPEESIPDQESQLLPLDIPSGPAQPALF